MVVNKLSNILDNIPSEYGVNMEDFLNKPISILQLNGDILPTSYLQKNILELLSEHYPVKLAALPLSFHL